jgi:hypothetical protein
MLWKRLLLEKLIVAQLVTKFSPFHEEDVSFCVHTKAYFLITMKMYITLVNITAY